MNDHDRDLEIRQAVVVGFTLLRRLLRGVPDLDERGPEGRSLVVEAHVVALKQAVSGVTGQDIQDAMRGCLVASPFFPTPAELIEQVRQNRRQGLLLAAESAVEARLRALPAGPEAEASREAAKAALAEMRAMVAGRLRFEERPLPRRTLAEMEAEVERLREADASVKAKAGG